MRSQAIVSTDCDGYGRWLSEGRWTRAIRIEVAILFILKGLRTLSDQGIVLTDPASEHN